jgi:carbamoyl-phosphate synthase large subunit
MQQVVNVLFLGGAKRVSMARLLIAAGAKRNLDIKIFSYELSNEVPIAEVATVIVGRKWRDAELQSHLHDVVDKYGINIMLPFVDPAVEVAATYCANVINIWQLSYSIKWPRIRCSVVTVTRCRPMHCLRISKGIL